MVALAGGASSCLVAGLAGQPPHSINNEACDRSGVRPANRGAAPPLRRIICQGSIDRTRTMTRVEDLGDGEEKKEERTTRLADVSLSD